MKNKSTIITICLIAIVIVLSLVVLFLIKPQKPNITASFNENMNINSFEEALNIKNTDNIEKMFLSVDDKDKYKEWLNSIKKGSEVDVIFRNSKYKINRLVEGDLPSLEVTVSSPDLVKIVDSTINRLKELQLSEVIYTEILSNLDKEDAPQKESTISIPLVRNSDGSYGLEWNEQTINLLSGNVFGLAEELEKWKVEKLEDKMNTLVELINEGD